MARKKIKSITDQRPFVIVYHDFLENNVLDEHEKIIFIALKKFADNNNQCFPSLKKLSDIARISKRKVQDTLKKLEQKKIISIENRLRTDGGDASNLYTLYDFKELWINEDDIETKRIIEQEQKEKAIKLLESMGYTVTKEKEPTSVPTKVTDVSTQIKNDKNKLSSHKQNTTPAPKSQELQKQERYALDEIKQLFEYEIMLQDNPCLQKDIDSVMDILYNAMNTTKPLIRIAGEDKPNMVVIGKLMKLNKESIVYAINKFSEQTEKIRNPAAYMLTILYNAPEQFTLYIQNQLQYNIYNQDNKDMECKKYDYDDLEKQLLNFQI